MQNHNKYLLIGKTVKPHGLRGHIKMHVYCDEIDFSTVYINNQEFEIENLKLLGDQKSLIKFKKLDHINDIEALCKQDVLVEKSNLPESEIYFQDLIGMKVYNDDEHVTDITDVSDFGAGVVLDTKLDCMIHWKEVESFDKKAGKVFLKKWPI